MSKSNMLRSALTIVSVGLLASAAIAPAAFAGVTGGVSGGASVWSSGGNGSGSALVQGTQSASAWAHGPAISNQIVGGAGGANSHGGSFSADVSMGAQGAAYNHSALTQAGVESDSVAAASGHGSSAASSGGSAGGSASTSH